MGAERPNGGTAEKCDEVASLQVIELRADALAGKSPA
jgi:hypothetical protein